MTAPSLMPFVTHVFWDPAIDHAQSNIGKFIETRDVAHLVMRAGAKPATYHLRAIPNRLVLDHLATEPNIDRKRQLAFRAALVRVEHAELGEMSTPLWQPQVVGEAQRTSEGRGLSRIFTLVSDDELELFDPPTVMEIGEVALTRAFLPKAFAASYALPPTSRRLLIMMHDLLVGMTRTALAGTSESSPAPATSD